MRKGTKKKLKTAKEASLQFQTRGTPNNLQTLQKFLVPDFKDISVIITESHRYSSSLDILSSSFFRKANIVCLLFIVSQTCFNKKHLLKIFVNNEFSLFFELLDNVATHITRMSEEDPAELCQPRRRGFFKHIMGTEELDKANSRKQMW